MKEKSPQQPTATVSSVLLRASREEASSSRKTVAGKKVKFSTPPKWRARHAMSGLKQRRGRPALRTLQPAASNPRHLVGAGSPRSQSIGKPKKTGRVLDTKEKRVVVPGQKPVVGSITVSEKAVQTKDTTTTGTGSEPSIDYKMITEEVPPVEYWQVLAEQRRLALVETLQENEELHGEVERLKLKVTELETQVQNVDYFAMMYSLAVGQTEDSTRTS